MKCIFLIVIHSTRFCQLLKIKAEGYRNAAGTQARSTRSGFEFWLDRLLVPTSLSVCIVSCIYFCLCWAFVAAHGLSLVAALGLLTAVSSLVAGHRALDKWASVAAALRLSSFGAWA